MKTKISKKGWAQLFLFIISMPGIAITGLVFLFLGFTLSFHFCILLIIFSIISIILIIIKKQSLFEILDKIFEEETPT